MRQSGRALAFSSPANNFSVFLPVLPSFFVKNSERVKSLAVSENRSDSSVMI
jgi:hypothetical protein